MERHSSTNEYYRMGFILHRGGAHGHSHGGSSHGHAHEHAHEEESSKTVSRNGIFPKRAKSAPNNLTAVIERSTDSQSDDQLPQQIETVIIAHDKADLESAMPEETQGQHKKSAANINVRAAFIHVVGDFLQSLGVFVAALVIYFKVYCKERPLIL